MNVKKEIFESLRLDLQEFAPQEFVAVCYYYVCIGINNGYQFVYSSSNGNRNSYEGTIDQSSSHRITYQNNQPPYTIARAYVNNQKKSNNGASGDWLSGTYYYFEDDSGDLHVGTSSSFIQSEPSRPNVSG